MFDSVRYFAEGFRLGVLSLHSSVLGRIVRVWLWLAREPTQSVIARMMYNEKDQLTVCFSSALGGRFGNGEARALCSSFPSHP